MTKAHARGIAQIEAAPRPDNARGAAGWPVGGKPARARIGRALQTEDGPARTGQESAEALYSYHPARPPLDLRHDGHLGGALGRSE